MARIREFVGDRRGGMPGRIGALSGAIALACVVSAHFLDVASRDGNSRLYAWLGKKPGVDFMPTATIRKSAGVDYTPTGSVKQQAGGVVLDPCTGKPR